MGLLFIVVIVNFMLGFMLQGSSNIETACDKLDSKEAENAETDQADQCRSALEVSGTIKCHYH